MADFNKQIGFSVSESFKAESDRVNSSWKEVNLPTTETDNAKTSVTGLTGGLKDLNGQYDVVITKTVDTGAKIVDFSNTANNTKFGLNTESVAGTVASFEQITKSANDAKYAINSLEMADAAKRKSDIDAAAKAKADEDARIAKTPIITFAEKYASKANSIGSVSASSIEKNDLSLIVTKAQNALISSGIKLKDVEKSYNEKTLFNVKIKDGNVIPSWDIGGAFAVSAGAFGDRSQFSKEISPDDKFPSMERYALGGIANTASIFGESGAEAAVPLPDGRTIPVTLSRDSANDSGETVAELKEISRKQEIMINTLIAAAQESRKQNQVLVTEIEGLRTDTRLRRAA
jgi:hypothetical protein